MGVRIDLNSQVFGVLPVANGGATQGASGASGVYFSDSEAPSGTQNSVNTTFTLSNAPFPKLSLLLFKNGSLLKQNVDYMLAVATLTMTVAPGVSDVLLAWYRYIPLLLSITEGHTLYDSMAFGIGTQVSESIAFGDVDDDIYFFALGIGLLLNDSITFSDAFGPVAYLSDSIAFSDTDILMLNLALHLSDSITFSDAFVKVNRVVLTKTFTDSVTLSDAFAKTLS